jgi:hypothetical protein
MSTIYVVLGQTGEYSDRREWLVKAVTTENKAKELVLELSDAVRGSENWNYWICREFKHPLDPKCEVELGGVVYWYDVVELEDK